MSPHRFLITGGAGFIGSAVVRLAIQRGHTVLNVDKLTYASSLDAIASVSGNAAYTFLRADVGDRQAMLNALREFRPTGIIHLAAESHVDRSIDGPAAFIESNVRGTFELLEACRTYWETLEPSQASGFRFVQVSTDEVFGSLGESGTFTEDSRYDPSSPYSASKAAGDHLARAWFRTYGFPSIVTNCSNNYGPFQFPEKLIPLAIERSLSGIPIPVYGRGDNVRDWLFVDDHAEGLLAAATSGAPGATYLFGSRSERTNLQVISALCSALDEIRPEGAPHEKIEFVVDRPGHDHRYAIDPTSAENGLGWRALRSFEEGILATVRWYLDNREWAVRIGETKYTGNRLGMASGK